MGMGPVSPDPEGTGAVSPDPEGTGSILPDPEGEGSVSLDGVVPPPTTTEPSVWVWVKPLTPEGARACLDVTHGHDRPRPGVRIANSDGCVGAVLPNPRTPANKHVDSPRRPPGRDGTPRPADDVETKHQW